MYAYLPLVAGLARRVRASYHRQITARARPDHGAFIATHDGVANADHSAHAQSLTEAGYAFLLADSPLAGDDELFARLLAAIAFQRRWQRPEGLIDLISVNWVSPPDTGFTVQLLAPVVALARTVAADGDERAARIATDLGAYVASAAAGMIGRGFHTPNHRWVVCSALALALTLFPDLPARPYLDAILAEGIDANADGEFTERSTGIYNAVCDRSLRLMAEVLGRPALLDPVRRNLDLMTQLFHADGTVVTSSSNRQDRGRRIVPLGLADSLYDLARRDDNGVWAFLADRLVALTPEEQHNAWLLQPFIATPAYRRDTLPREPLPDGFRHLFPVAGIWRIKRGPLSATAARDNTTAFALRYGQAELTALKIAGTYHSTALFAADELVPHGAGVRLAHRGSTRRLPGYELPLGRPVPFGTFAASRGERERWTLPTLDLLLDIAEVPGGFDLHLRSRGGVDRITCQIECCFAGPGEWETDDQALAVTNGQTALLKRGIGRFRRGDDAITIGPGAAAHRIWQMRGTEPEPDTFRILITLQTPLDYPFQIRFGHPAPLTSELLPPS